MDIKHDLNDHKEWHNKHQTRRSKQQKLCNKHQTWCNKHQTWYNKHQTQHNTNKHQTQQNHSKHQTQHNHNKRNRDVQMDNQPPADTVHTTESRTSYYNRVTDQLLQQSHGPAITYDGTSIRSQARWTAWYVSRLYFKDGDFNPDVFWWLFLHETEQSAQIIISFGREK